MTHFLYSTLLHSISMGLRGINSFHRAVRASRFWAGGWPALFFSGGAA